MRIKEELWRCRAPYFCAAVLLLLLLSPRTGDDTAPLSPSFSPHLPGLLVSIKSIFRLCFLLRLRRSIRAGPTCREAIHPLFCFSCSPPHVSATLFSVNIRRGICPSPPLPSCLSSPAYLLPSFPDQSFHVHLLLSDIYFF